jgi:hypothetical protein
MTKLARADAQASSEMTAVAAANLAKGNVKSSEELVEE